jgi:iron complex transport system ATP-binding protein
MKLLQGKGLSLKLGGRQILDRVDIDLRPGEMLGLIGPNGAGKSTLLRLLAGLLAPDAGSLRLADRDYADIPLEQRTRRIAWLAQQGEVHWPVTVETLLELGRAPHLAPWQQLTQTDRRVIERVLAQSDLTELRQRPFNTLSGGERARVLLARALVGEPQILLADEPVAALDPAHQLDVMATLQNQCSDNQGVIVVLHDLALAARYCDRLLLLHQGHVIATGSTAEVLTQDNLAKVYQIEICAPTQGTPVPLGWQRVAKSYQGPG